MSKGTATARTATPPPAGSRTAGAAAIVAVLACALAPGVGASAGAARLRRTAAGMVSRARSTHHRSGNANVHLHLVRTSGGSKLVEEGSASGSVSGHVRAVLHVGAILTGSFTFYTRNGQIRGHGSAHPRGSGRYQSFAGTEVITGGTGLFQHARGHGQMSGTFDRRTYAVVIKTRGTISY